MATFSREPIRAALDGPAAVPAVDAIEQAADATDRYCSNTELYVDPALTEGADYGRRYRRHATFDDSSYASIPFPQTAVLAVHGGGIEPGTSELCLAVAGYHPATMAVTPAEGPVYDFWIFEGLLPADNDQLHVTSIHCDDPVAELLCAGTPRALALHGCTPARAGRPDGTPAVLVGGLATDLKDHLLTAYAETGVPAVDAAARPNLDGGDPRNIVNRTFTGRGAQLELTTPLRAAMFDTNTAAQRKHTTTAVFWQFVAATRQALSVT
jgi:phage replication-related protein YjqB (UPF0714/DUF867 family)